MMMTDSLESREDRSPLANTGTKRRADKQDQSSKTKRGKAAQTASDLIQVVLADDHRIMREGLTRLLEDSRDLEVIGQAEDGRQAITMTLQLKPSVLVLDYSLPDMDGTAVTKKIHESRPDMPILMLTMHDNIHYVLKAMEAGAAGYLVKSDATEELVQAIHVVHEGRSYISPHLSEAVADHLRKPRGHRVGLAKLSTREFELLGCLVQGMTLQAAAKHLHVSESTVSTYRSRLLNKLDVNNNAQLIRFALDQGVKG